MAPDLNSVPASPRVPQSGLRSQQPSLPPSRRASQIYPMNPPPLPLASPSGAIPASVQTGHVPFPPLSPESSGTSGVPIRHPRPMTPAEMHLELEKEQEAIVNRLTRELSALRAHSSSVASTTSISSSSTNAHGTGIMDPLDPSFTGPNHPAQLRPHRSSSSVSTSQRPDLTASTPSAAARNTGLATIGGGPAMPTTPRYEEVMVHRAELEEAKKENERLRRRVRELEAMVRGRRASSVSVASAERDRSVSMRGREGQESTGAGS